jgi:hypothetical protein
MTCTYYDTTGTHRSAAFLDIHLEIYNEGRLKSKLCDKRDYFNFPIINFPYNLIYHIFAFFSDL